MNQEEVKNRIQKLSESGNELAGYFLALIDGVSPEMQQMFLQQAADALTFADSVRESSRDPEFLRDLESRSTKRGK